mgnify:CR=1 FL=1
MRLRALWPLDCAETDRVEFETVLIATEKLPVELAVVLSTVTAPVAVLKFFATIVAPAAVEPVTVTLPPPDVLLEQPLVSFCNDAAATEKLDKIGATPLA